MGSATYRFLLDQMAAGKTEADQKWPYRQPTWVFTNRDLSVPPGSMVTLCKGDVRPVHEQMKAASQGKNIWIVGGGDLAGQFHDAGLLDEVILQIGSVVLGAGKPALPRAIPFPDLQLSSVQRFGAGMAELRYTVRTPQ